MAHDHGEAGHSHDHTAGANAKMLRWALALTATYLVAEVVGAFVFNSLALLSDAAHMMTDVAGLVIALMAIHLGKKAADDKRTFGYKRLEILAATFNAILLFVVAMYILYEAIQRFREPQSIQSTGMLIVAVIGLVVNFVSMRLLTAGKEEPIRLTLRKLLALRAYMRRRSIEDVRDTTALDAVGLTERQAEEMYRVMAIANYEDRFVIPTAHKEVAENAYDQRGIAGFHFGQMTSEGNSRFMLWGQDTRKTRGERFPLDRK